jgi:hypothetical protein
MKRFVVILTFAFFVFLPSVQAIDTASLLSLTNQQRVAANLSPLVLNSKLSQAAEVKANDMITNNYWAHVSPTGVTPWTLIRQTGYQYQYAGENLAEDYSSAEAVVNAWMNSPGHRKNLLNPKLCEVGFASVGNITVQMMACPKKISASPAKSLFRLVSALLPPSQIAYLKSLLPFFRA